MVINYSKNRAKKIFTLILVYYTLLGFPLFAQSTVKNSAGFPKWLIDGKTRTDQTSGIAFLRSDNNFKEFLLADDIGNLFRLKIHADSSLILTPIELSKEVKEYFEVFPKKDFEEITFDRYNGAVYLSVEGNSVHAKKFTGIFQLIFARNSVFSDTIVKIQKIEFVPESVFLENVTINLGYEGIACDDKYFYLGLEGIRNEKEYADSSIIYIAEKQSSKIVKKVFTRSLGIGTVCGLFSDSTLSLWGIDRNKKNIFRIRFREDLTVTEHFLLPFHTAIPGYDGLTYTSAPESITSDDEGNLYLVDDPWREKYVPPETTLEKLSPETIRNFREHIPIIYKFSIISE